MAKVGRMPAEPKSNLARRVWTVFLLPAVLALAAISLFARSLPYGFVYDSYGQVFIGDYIHQPRHLLDVLTFRVLAMDELDFNRPVELASLMCDSLVWGRHPFGYHLTNILLHAAAVVLAFRWLRQLAVTPMAAFLAALLFAVHPLVTEAVCEPSNRKDILAAIFGLGALLTAGAHRADRRDGDVPRVLLASLLTLLAVGAKEVGVAIPPVMGLYWWLFRRDEPRRYWVGAVGGSGAAVAGFLTARFALAHPQSEIFTVPATYPGGSLSSALLLQPRILALYLWHVVWPANLSADYTYSSVRDLTLPLAGGVLIVTGGALAWWSYRDRRAALGTGLVVASLLPVCNLVPIYCPAADRYLYLPLIGLAVLVAAALDGPFLAPRPRARHAATAMALLAAAALAHAAWQREGVWASTLLLWEDTLQKDPVSYRARKGCADELLTAHRLDEAGRQYETLLRGPGARDGLVWAGYAIVLDGRGDWQRSAVAARRALYLKPDLRDTEKMVRTMQCDRPFTDDFSRITSALPEDPLTGH